MAGRGRIGIVWQKGDYIKLGKAISQFNKKIKELEKETDNLNLPEIQDYETKKNQIVTRNELNRYIKSLNRFQKETQQKEVKIESDILITKWEETELKKARNRIRKNLKTELEQLNEPLPESKYSRAQMRKYKSTRN